MTSDAKCSADAGGAPATDPTSTQLISRVLVVDGVEFHWWAVGASPALVTVRSRVFGGRTEFAQDDPERIAKRLAESILDKHYRRKPAPPPEALRDPAAPPPVDVFSKPGWFSRS